MGVLEHRMELYETIIFRYTILANSSGVVSERIKALGTIEGIRVNFPPGPAGTLHIRPRVRRLGASLDDMLTYPELGNKYISGDNVLLPYKIIFPVVNDEYVDIYYKNNDLSNSHELSVDVEIDYYGGKNRVIGGLA